MVKESKFILNLILMEKNYNEIRVKKIQEK